MRNLRSCLLSVALTLTVAMNNSRSNSVRVRIDSRSAAISSLPYVLMGPNRVLGETVDHVGTSSAVLINPFTHEL
jgi:hypothetical protein